MKKCKILPLLGILFLISSIFVSCKDTRGVEPSTTHKDKVRIELTATVVKEIPTNKLKGFTLGSEREGDVKRTPINWVSDTWSNDDDHKPRLACVVRNEVDHSIKQIIEIDKDQYTYHKGDGTSQDPAKVIISALIDAADPNTDELVFYLFDKDQGADIQSNSGTIDFDGGAMLYDTTGSTPTFQKKIDSDTFVEPNNRIYFNFIFAGSIPYRDFLSNIFMHDVQMYPQGSLLMVDFKSTIIMSTLNKYYHGELKNPGDLCYFNPTLSTDAFDLTGKIDLATGLSTNSENTDKIGTTIHFMSYNPGDNSTTRWENNSRNIATNENLSQKSPIYVKYVLPRNNGKYSIVVYRNKYRLFGSSDRHSFFERNNSKRLDIQLEIGDRSLLPEREEKPFFYNALSYVGLYNVNKAQDNFNYCNSSGNNALVNYDDATSMFTNKYFLKNQYHLPTDGEFRSIWTYIPRAYFQKIDKVEDDTNNLNKQLKYQIGKAEITNVISEYRYQEEPIGSGNYVTYALRFIYCNQTKWTDGRDVNEVYNHGQVSPFLSAWRYEYVDNPNGGGKMLDIYCYAVNVAKYHKTRVNTYGLSLSFDRGDGAGSNYIMSKKFFEDRKGSKEFAHRVFPVPQGHSIGTYWTFTIPSLIPLSGIPVYYFNKESARAGYQRDKSYLYCVRPFLNPPSN